MRIVTTYRHWLLALVACLACWGAHAQAPTVGIVARLNAENQEVWAAVMQWRINGHPLRFGDDTLRLPVDHVPDTIYYQQRENAPWDTLVTQFDSAWVVGLAYNDCCAAFNSTEPDMRHWLDARFEFKVLGMKKGKRYVVMLGDAGNEVRIGQSIFVETICHSMVVPNIFRVRIMEVVEGVPGDTTNVTICLPDLQFLEVKPVRTYVNFLFMPARKGLVRLTYDVRRRKLSWN